MWWLLILVPVLLILVWRAPRKEPDKAIRESGLVAGVGLCIVAGSLLGGPAGRLFLAVAIAGGLVVDSVVALEVLEARAAKKTSEARPAKKAPWRMERTVQEWEYLSVYFVSEYIKDKYLHYLRFRPSQNIDQRALAVGFPRAKGYDVQLGKDGALRLYFNRDTGVPEEEVTGVLGDLGWEAYAATNSVLYFKRPAA